MNRKQRMDAIERRLDYLEANAAGEDDDRFSCVPTGYLGLPLSTNPDDPPDTVVIGETLDGEQIRFTPRRHQPTNPDFDVSTTGWKRPEYEPDDDHVIRNVCEAHLRSLADCVRHPERWDLSARSLADVLSPEDEREDYDAAIQVESLLADREVLRVPLPPGFKAEERVGDAWVPMSEERRARVRERSNLADTLAGSSEQTWKDTALRYETSLHALREMTILRTDPMASDFYALIQGCLYGGTITSEGLRTDE